MRRQLFLACLVAVWPTLVAASDVGVPGSSFSMQRNVRTGAVKLKSVQKGGDVHLGAAATPPQMSGRFDVYYVDAPGNRGQLPIPAPWTTVTPSQAKYKNRLAPAGPTTVQSALVKAGKLAQLSARGLGGFDLSQSPGPGGVVVVFTLENAAGPSTSRFCTKYASAAGSILSYKSTVSGQRLKLKRGVPTACPTCNDGVQNGNETGTDCGGGTCPGCGVGTPCNVDGDCVTGLCNMQICAAASCSDGMKNGDESDVDCGGSACSGCADGDDCDDDGDCASGVCDGQICQAPTCSDGVQNGTESDDDCGGGTCPACAPGGHCGGPSDCTSMVCSGNVCQVGTCTDGIQNGNETDVDCGWTCPGCTDGDGCGTGGDCQSGVCTGNVCQAPACDDGVENGMETDLDCGGPCDPCGNGGTCGVPADCASGVCTGSVCQTPTCIDGVQNGGESDVDCGGPSCADCGTGDTCNGGGDCQSGVCIGNLCQAPTCVDGVQNGGESDVDCGGPSCADCAINRHCVGNSDCLSNFCTSGLCKCPGKLFTFTMNSNNGGAFDSAEWPGGTATLSDAPGCNATINRPNDNIDKVCTLASPFSVAGFNGYSSCSGTGGEDGDGCQPVSCPPAGVGSCCSGRPSCSAALNGSGSARYFVQCNP